MMKKIIYAIIVVGLLTLIPIPTLAMTGSGTPGDPYVIYNVTDLQNVSLDVTAYYVLNNTIDASDTITWNGGLGFDPIESFTGSFNGSSYTITGLYINRTDRNVGLFGGMTSGTPVICNVTIEDAYVKTVYTSTNKQATAGVLLGAATSNANPHISGVIVSGTVYVALTDTGLTPSGHQFAHGGGLIGMLWEGSGHVDECAAYVDVTSFGYMYAGAYGGGLIGGFGTWYGSSAYVNNCYARGNVTGSASYGTAALGGFIGYHHMNGNQGDCLVDDCYSTGAAAKGFIHTSQFPGDVTNCFWDKETSGALTSAAGTGKTTAEMKTQSTFTDAGWDFTTIWAMFPLFNDGYPYFQWWAPTFGNLTNAVQVLWFQPDDIIHGTTLPDRTTPSEDGVIHWGTNPVGVDIEMGPLLPWDPNPEYELPDDIVTPPQDMTGPTGNPRWNKDLSTLEDHPFYPVIKMISDQTAIPVPLVWTIGGILILLVAMAITYKYAPHQIITALVGGGLSAFFYHMCIFPFWVIFIFVVMAIAIIIGERSPTVS